MKNGRIILFLLTFSAIISAFPTFSAKAQMPFYGLNPSELVLRSEFSTDYSKSSAERKNNIKVAARSLNGVMVEPNGEFSFNLTVGARTEKRGYKSAKIIVKGEFTEGVGGGVCQVSTTLYNAVLLAGLRITEYHPHSLRVSYVEPSFDAMVNSGSADFRFINETSNPIIIKTSSDGNRLTVKLFGEKNQFEIKRKSVITEELPPTYEKVEDFKNEFPDLFMGEERIVSYGKAGLKSEGYLIYEKDGKKVTKKIRGDKYSPINGKIVIGRALPPQDGENSSEEKNKNTA